MTCTPFKGPDGVSGFICTRGRGPKPRCSVCKTPAAGRLCDGCDKPVCPACAVGTHSEEDFCPTCFAPAWAHWLAKHGGPLLAAGERAAGTAATFEGLRMQRRRAFRAWVRANAKEFLSLVTARSMEAEREKRLARDGWEFGT